MCDKKDIVFVWIPGHVGILGNIFVDLVANMLPRTLLTRDWRFLTLILRCKPHVYKECVASGMREMSRQQVGFDPVQSGSSSSSVLPAVSLRFTILCEIFAYVTIFFLIQPLR